jgi:hypothetical protein
MFEVLTDTAWISFEPLGRTQNDHTASANCLLDSWRREHT